MSKPLNVNHYFEDWEFSQFKILLTFMVISLLLLLFAKYMKIWLKSVQSTCQKWAAIDRSFTLNYSKKRLNVKIEWTQQQQKWMTECPYIRQTTNLYHKSILSAVN